MGEAAEVERTAAVTRPELIVCIRESHMVECDRCGAFWDLWESSISLEDALARIDADPDFLGELETRPCPNCGRRIERGNVVIAPEARWGELSPSRQRRFFGTMRRLLREGADRNPIAAELRRRYGAEGIYVEKEPG